MSDRVWTVSCVRMDLQRSRTKLHEDLRATAERGRSRRPNHCLSRLLLRNCHYFYQAKMAVTESHRANIQTVSRPLKFWSHWKPKGALHSGKQSLQTSIFECSSGSHGWRACWGLYLLCRRLALSLFRLSGHPALPFALSLECNRWLLSLSVQTQWSSAFL